MLLNCYRANVHREFTDKLNRDLEVDEVISLTGVVTSVDKIKRTAKVHIFAASVRADKFSASTSGSDIHAELEIEME